MWLVVVMGWGGVGCVPFQARVGVEAGQPAPAHSAAATAAGPSTPWGAGQPGRSRLPPSGSSVRPRAMLHALHPMAEKALALCSPLSPGPTLTPPTGALMGSWGLSPGTPLTPMPMPTLLCSSPGTQLKPMLVPTLLCSSTLLMPTPHAVCVLWARRTRCGSWASRPASCCPPSSSSAPTPSASGAPGCCRPNLLGQWYCPCDTHYGAIELVLFTHVLSCLAA